MDSLNLAALVQEYAQPLTQSVMVVATCFAVFAILCRALKRMGNKGYMDSHMQSILGNLAKWLIVIVGILLILGFFGVSVGTLWAALSGVLALIALGFVAVWSVLSNALCSILLIIFPPFRIGDYIEIQEPTGDFFVRGRVVSINMLMTSLEVDDDAKLGDVKQMLRVPNNIFFQKYVRCIPGKSTQSLRTFISNQHDNQSS